MKLKEKWEFIVIILIIILAIVCFFKDEKQTLKEDNPLKNYPFYKENNHNRYLAYQQQTNLDDKTTILYVNIGLDQAFYTNIKETNNLYTNYLIVNKYNYLPSNYIPNNLVQLTEYAKSNIFLDRESYESFKKMARDASLNALNLRIVSAYRSYEYQDNLYNNYLKKEPKAVVDTYSARAGHSEHQTGLAIDIDNTHSLYTDFENTEEFLWMNDNCYKYGFILRYPKGKEHITGYMYEPWHYRYVGIEISTYIYNNNLTYEEYYYEFID